MTQRDAVAIAFGWDRSEVSEYKYGRHRAGRVHLYDAGDGYACAVRDGATIPKAFAEYGPWTACCTIRGYTVYTGSGTGE